MTPPSQFLVVCNFKALVQGAQGDDVGNGDDGVNDDDGGIYDDDYIVDDVNFYSTGNHYCRTLVQGIKPVPNDDHMMIM